MEMEAVSNLSVKRLINTVNLILLIFSIFVIFGRPSVREVWRLPFYITFTIRTVFILFRMSKYGILSSRVSQIPGKLLSNQRGIHINLLDSVTIGTALIAYVMLLL